MLLVRDCWTHRILKLNQAGLNCRFHQIFLAEPLAYNAKPLLPFHLLKGIDNIKLCRIASLSEAKNHTTIEFCGNSWHYMDVRDPWLHPSVAVFSILQPNVRFFAIFCCNIFQYSNQISKYFKFCPNRSEFGNWKTVNSASWKLNSELIESM